MPRIATSGQLTIGVNDVPPMPPRLVIVNPPPCISSSDSLPARAFSETLASSADELDDALPVDVADDRHEQAAIGVSTATPMCIVLLVDDLAPRRVDRRVELRELLQRGRHDLQRDGGHRELAAGLLGLRSPLLAQRLEPVMSALSCCVTCGITFHACAEMLRRLAADVAHRLALDLAPLGEIGQRRRRCAAPARRPPPPGRSPAARNACTSSTLMRPPGPVPGTWRMSTPSSRARRRTDGAAGAADPFAGSPRCGAGLLAARRG